MSKSDNQKKILNQHNIKKASKDLSNQFFSNIRKYKEQNIQSDNRYIKMKKDHFELSPFSQLAYMDFKVKEIFQNQSRLDSLSKDTSIFASTQSQVQHLNIQIKDAITEVQADAEEIQRLLDQKRMHNQHHEKAAQTGVDIMNQRVFQATGNFKQFLQQHQITLKKQEEKKEKLTGKVNNRNKNIAGGARKVKILPQQYIANPNAGDQNYYGGHGGNRDTALAMEDEFVHQRASTIESVEKTLQDIVSMFKRFATIVSEQQVLVDRIDTNTENALYDLEGAKKELREVYDDAKSTRKLMLKIFFILIIFCTFYILFVL